VPASGLGRDRATEAKLAQVEGVTLDRQSQRPDAQRLWREGSGQDDGREGTKGCAAGTAGGQEEEAEERTQRAPRQR
jgi:hypothetical protein